MDIVKRISAVVWDEGFWLPKNVTWRHLQPTTDRASYPDFSHLIYPIPIAAIVFVLRLVIENVIYDPIGRKLKIPSRKAQNVTPNPVLEAAYKKNRKPGHSDLLALGKRCDLSERQVERWFRHRNSIRRGLSSQLDKFKETGWRFTFYFGIFLYGVWTLWDKPWFRDSSQFWIDYPYQTVSPDVWWYYMIELSFYWSLLFTQFFDVKRKDFWEMFFHHIITISLMSFSWTDNTVRVGSMVLLVHDCVDFWLEGAKLARYAKRSQLSTILFAIFTVVWITTRLGLYPYRILAYTFPCPMGDRCFPAFHFFNTLLGSLQVLHVFWTFTIIRVIYRALNTGEPDDVRSNTEESDNDLSDEPKSVIEPGTGDHRLPDNGSATFLGNTCLTNGKLAG